MDDDDDVLSEPAVVSPTIESMIKMANIDCRLVKRTREDIIMNAATKKTKTLSTITL